MSLVVWLPLNGDSHNQGLGEYTETTNTLSYAINGKVTEKCVDKGKLVYSKNPLQMVGTICFWLYPKPTAEKSSIIFGNNSFNVSERKWSLYMFPDNKSLHSWGCQKEGSTTFNGSFTYNNVLKESTWNHVCVAHDLKNEYIYVNGNLIGTVPWDSSGTYNFDKETDIIRDESLETGVNNFKINDFRIYDTCLSKAEIKEIAKGMMLHYTFENPYVTETTNIPHSISIHDNHVGEATLGSDSTGNYINKTNMTFWSGLGIDAGSLLIKSGRYYTWSMEVMPIKDIEYVIDGNITCSNSGHGGNDGQHFDIIRGYSHLNHKVNGSDTLPKGKLEAYKWTKMYFTVKVKDCTNPYISHTFVPYIPSGDSSVKVYYRNSQLEERMYDSPYTSSKRNPSTIKDNSGMGNNGTQVYQRIELPLTPKTQTTCSTLKKYGGVTNTYNSTNKTYTLNNFVNTDNAVCLLATMKYNNLYHYVDSVMSYEFDITLKDIVTVSGTTPHVRIQGPTIFKDDTFRWDSNPVSAIFFTPRLNNLKNGTYHVYIEKTIENVASNIDYYELGMRFDGIKSGTVTISNLHAYYGSLDTSKLTIADKSAVGSHSAYFNGKNYINCGVVTPSMMDELTASIWLYRDDWTIKPMLPLYSSFFGARDNGGFAIGPDRSITHLNFEVYYNSIGYIYPNVIDMTKLSTGWHLITSVADKNRIALYLDGELYDENVHNKNAQINMLFNNDSTIARMPVYVGAELDGWGTTPTLRTMKDYYIDDVRLYATALSDKDIKALYNVKTRIDNKSNLYCNQLIETKSKNMMKPLDKIDPGNDVYRYASSGTFTCTDGILKYTVSASSPSSTDANSGFYIRNANYGGALKDNLGYRITFYVRVSKAGTYVLGDERVGVITKSLESGVWYKIIQEGPAVKYWTNFPFYNRSRNLASGDTIEVKDIQIIRLYDTEDYLTKITKKGQYKTFELNESIITDLDTDAKIVSKYDATWLRVFHHNTNNNTVWFADEAEALHCNSQYKYSILDELEKFRNENNNFEFLLEYPQDLPDEYNRWIQSDNPATTLEDVTLNGSKSANGYTAIHIDWNYNYWGGLLKTVKGAGSTHPARTFIDGSVNHGNWYYAIGCYNNVTNDWQDVLAGPNNTPKTSMKEVNLYVRIDNKSFKQYFRETDANEVIEI